VVSCAVLVLLAGFAWAGPLNPPVGSVTSTYKTLTEVEPRIIVNATNTPGSGSSSFIISQPGSYYLDRNLTGEASKVGITITAPGVTLDLNGFAMLGATGATNAINLNASFITVKNGTIRGWPGRGVSFINSAFEHRMEDLTVEANTGRGLELREGAIVRHCQIKNNAGGAVRLAFGGVMTDSQVGGPGTLVDLIDGATVDHCVLDGTGILIQSSSLGVRGNTIKNNTISTSGTGDGIVLSGPNHLVVDNTILGDGTAGSVGISAAAGSTGLVLRNNIVKNTADNYSLVSGTNNQYDLLLCQIPETIDVPANVTLTGSLSLPAGSNAFGLTISADNVSVDFAGHTLTGTPTSGNGVHINGAFRNLRVANGTVRGFQAGIVINDGSGAAGSDSTIEDMRVMNNRREGVMGGNVLQMRRCTVTQNGAAGVSTVIAGDGSIIEGSRIAGNTNTGAAIQCGEGALVRGNVVESNAGTGIQVGSSGTIANNNVAQNSGAGIIASTGNLIEHNNVRGNQFEGIAVVLSNTVTDNSLDFNARAAGNQANISATGLANRIERNTLNGADIGLVVTSTRNIVLSNRAGSNTLNYSIAGGNTYGPIVNVIGVGDITATANANHPGANYSY